MIDYEIINKCMLCQGKLELVLSLGDTPLANEFVEMHQTEDQDLFPLNLMRCKKCNHVQLDCIVNEDRLYRNYSYVSGTSSVNIKHFKDYAAEIMFNYEIIPFENKDYLYFHESSKNINKTILEIASNDGTFLKNFIDYKFNVIGIDPALNLKEVAKLNGIDTITEFFNKDTAINIIKPHYKDIKVIVCNNMFAHNKNLGTIVEGVKELLSDDGIFVFENSYLLDILDNNLIDLIYHEHMHHHHITALQKFFDKYDMEIFNVKRLPNHGGSIRVYTCKKGSGERKIQPIVNELIELEKDISNKLNLFKQNALKLKKDFKDKLKKFTDNGKKIVVYGFAAKSTTLLYYFDIDKEDILYGIDDAILKQNKRSPGKHIPIYSDAALIDNSTVLILGWNFAPSIIDNHENFKGTWIIPLPEYKEVNI